MSRLSEILDQMTVVLNDLKTVMDAEQQHLSSGHINGSALQRITEDKVRYWRRWIIWSSSDALSKILSAAPMMILSAGRPLQKKPSTCAISTSITAGYWKVRLSVISRRLRY
jgi:hypothetical protein